MQACPSSRRRRFRAASSRRARGLPIALACSVATLDSGVVLAASAHTDPDAQSSERGDATEASTPARYREPGRSKFTRCADHEDPCVRPGPARALLLSLGALAGGAAAGLLFAVGDRHAPGDPAVLLVGTGALAGIGAIVGFITAAAGGEGPALADRVRPSTVGLAYTWAGFVQTDERAAHGISLSFAPTLRFRDELSRIRLIGHFGGWPLERLQVDPRPQNVESIPGQEGTAPIVLRQRRISAGIGLDLAVALPYPLGPLSAFLGPAELRWKPMFEIRRERFERGSAPPLVVERTMLLPLTAGVRWHVSARQRFTFYAGPRFDLVAYSEPGADELQRGRPLIGPLYAEAWYDIDIPLVGKPGDAGPHTTATSQITLGYVHSRFDDLGFNFGPVIGFLGPVHVGWTARVRPPGAKLAVQTGINTQIGNGLAVTVGVGLVVPDLHTKRRRAR